MSPDDARAAGLHRRIADLERELDAQLQDRRQVQRLDLAFLRTAEAWSEAVWDAAGAFGAAGLTLKEIDAGMGLARRPVFICGAHRSGTTLLCNLLDGHPSLVALPCESAFYTNLERPLADMERCHRAAFLGRKWLQRMVNPINQPPYWLFGRSGPQTSPYVDFARAFRTWWSVFENRPSAHGSSWPLAAFALAYAGRTGRGRIPPGTAMWVEKTPTNEQYLDRLWAEFPDAKVLHVIRRPDAVLSSYKALVRSAGRPARAMIPAVRNLARSYRSAVERSRREPADRYRLIRYEHLVTHPSEVMARVAGFLNIEPSPALLQPTVAGLAATANTSFAEGRQGTAQGLTRTERDLLALAVGRDAALLGYEGAEPASALAHGIMALRRFTQSGA